MYLKQQSLSNTYSHRWVHSLALKKRVLFMAYVFTFGYIYKIKQTEEGNWEVWAVKESNPSKETQVSERFKQCFESVNPSSAIPSARIINWLGWQWLDTVWNVATPELNYHRPSFEPFLPSSVPDLRTLWLLDKPFGMYRQSSSFQPTKGRRSLRPTAQVGCLALLSSAFWRFVPM